MGIGIYVRVSTAMQVTDGTSLDKQTELCLKKIEELGLSDSDVTIYREEGYSGEDIDIRPEMMRLREDVANGLISCVVCIHPDRLSRDMTDKLLVCREFEKNGAELIFTDTDFEKSPEGLLFFNIISAIAAYELALIKKRTIRGRLQAVEKNQQIMPMRVAPYGYDYTEGRLLVNEEEAHFVRLIYHWYVYEHLTMRDIGKRLYDLGAIPKRGESKNWSASSILRIISSEIYVGKYYYNRRKTKKVKGQTTLSGNPKKTYQVRDEDEWILVPVTPIVEFSLWSLAQDQREKNKRNKSIGNNKNEFLLKGLLKCAHCGRKYQATTYTGKINKETGERERYRCYRCPNITPRKYGPEIEKCPGKSIRADLLEKYFWEKLYQIINEPEDFLEQRKKGLDITSIETALAALEHKIRIKETEKEKIKVMFRHGVISEEEMLEDMSKINNEVKMINQEILTYKDQIKNHLREEESIVALENKISKLRNQLDLHADYESKRIIIESLYSEILILFSGDEIQITSLGMYDRLDDKIRNMRLCLQSQEV